MKFLLPLVLISAVFGENLVSSCGEIKCYNISDIVLMRCKTTLNGVKDRCCYLRRYLSCIDRYRPFCQKRNLNRRYRKIEAKSYKFVKDFRRNYIKFDCAPKACYEVR
ncbi:hypothetical protein ElyMa_003149300 [Elysia marginata]|uniref:Uncharacterized protein n=1 Tax=Elysia marginata TaxID=1093978 RepID=A0AAV4ITN5_9GAST|nr:hypothetical protein ElyMa_003149300 [Elysia marginata]